MGFVKTPQEIAAIERVLANPRFTEARRAYLHFRSTAEFVEAVLPPGLAPDGEPSVTVTVGQFGSNCVGDFAGATISIPARYGEHRAAYVLAMYMSTDHAIIFGRELFGEPKKQAEITLELAGDRVTGRVTRLGTRLIELDVALGPDGIAGGGPAEARAATFNVKALPAADGRGLEDDAIVTLAEFDNTLTLHRPGDGRLTLSPGPLDPLDEIPVLEITGAGYVEGDLSTRCRSVGRIPAADFLPYAYGRMDDWSLLDTSGGETAAAAE